MVLEKNSFTCHCVSYLRGLPTFKQYIAFAATPRFSSHLDDVCRHTLHTTHYATALSTGVLITVVRRTECSETLGRDRPTGSTSTGTGSLQVTTGSWKWLCLSSVCICHMHTCIICILECMHTWYLVLVPRTILCLESGPTVYTVHSMS